MAEAIYWEDFYKKHGAALVPSQFAAFALAEMPSRACIAELGCGNGRDSLFFARYGHKVIGIDKSHQAVDFAEKCAKAEGLPAQFICSDIADIDQNTDFRNRLETPLILYSRFFLHSIDEEAEAVFLDLCHDCLRLHGGKLFTEFRTDKDKGQYKQMGNTHYRRFIRLEDFLRRCEAAGLQAEYSIEGKGFAKYGAEDAYVARAVLHL